MVSYSSLPHWDGWEIQIQFAANGGGQSTLRWLWKQENQHRIVIPKLFLLADLRWFHARQAFLLASIFLIQILHLVLLGWCMRVLGGWRGTLWRTGFGLAAFCLFCPSQWENFVWGFQTCFVLSPLFATLSFVGLLLYWKRPQPASRWTAWEYLVLSIAAALGATYSLSNGNLLWPLLIAAALLLRLRVAALSFAVVGALSTAVYLHHYTRPQGVVAAAETPATLLKYLTSYFGSSWVSASGKSGFPSVPSILCVAEFIGLGGLILFLLLLLRLPSYVQACRPFCIQLDLTLLFCFGTGLITALARLGFGVAQAFSSHYQTISLFFWCCMALLLLGGCLPGLHSTRSDVFLPMQICLLGIIVVAAQFAQTPIRRARLRGFGLNAAAMALVTEVPDISQLRWADPPHPDYVLSLVPTLREQRLSAFAGLEPSLLGKPLESMFNLTSPNDCVGKLESATTIPSAWPRSLRITGWAWDYQHRQPPSLIVTATDGTINGLGAMGDWRPMNKTVRPWMTTNYAGYTGYVQDARSSSQVEVYAVIRGSPATACLIATTK